MENQLDEFTTWGVGHTTPRDLIMTPNDPVAQPEAVGRFDSTDATDTLSIPQTTTTTTTAARPGVFFDWTNKGKISDCVRLRMRHKGFAATCVQFSADGTKLLTSGHVDGEIEKGIQLVTKV